MARVTHAAQIDLRFGDPARELLGFSAGVCPGNFARERFDLFGQGWIGVNGQAQRVAERISGGSGTAAGGFWARTGASIRPVGPDLALTGHAALFPAAPSSQ